MDYGMRIYDPRIGRFPSVDPLSPSYPWYTPYSFAGNNPIEHVDLDGQEEFHFTLLPGKDGKAHFQVSSPPVYYQEHSWFGGLVKFKTEIQSVRYVVNYGSNTYYIGFASDKGRTNNFKVPLFQQFLKQPSSLKLFVENFDDVKQSRMKGFFQDMQISVASSLLAHQMIKEGVPTQGAPVMPQSELGVFSGGGTKLVSSAMLEKYPNSPVIGNPAETFIAPTTEVDNLLNSGASRADLMKALGIEDPKFLQGNLMRVDVNPTTLKNLNLRAPTGNEVGANGSFIPGGVTSGGVSEGVVNGIPKTDPGVTISTVKP